MKFKAVLFDLDGTLLDTLADLADSANFALEQMGFPTHPVDAYKIFVGDGVINLAARSIPDDSSNPTNIDKMVTIMRDEYSRRWNNKTKPYDGIADMLDSLSNDGLKLSVLSNKPHDFTLLCVEEFLGKWHFDVVQGVTDSVEPKPDPTGAIKVSQELDVPTEEFLYLGDTNTDMQTATAAGMYAVGVLWGFRSAEELEANGAKVLIEHPRELFELL